MLAMPEAPDCYAEGASLLPFNVQNPLSLRDFCMMPDDRQLI